MKRIFSIFFFAFSFLTVYSQNQEDTVTNFQNEPVQAREQVETLSNRAFGLSVGRENHHVSYLSPLLYTGFSLSYWNESINKKSHKRGDFYKLVFNRVNVSLMLPSHKANEMDAIYDVFEFNYYYDWKLTSKFHLLCGLYSGFEIGVDMLLSNSNNPVYIRADWNMIGLSLRPTLCIQAKRRMIKLSDQFNFRMAGFVFSPTYTQLYYDLSVPEYDRSEFVDFNSLSEKVRFMNKLMVEIPLRRRTLRLGMLVERSKSMINMIDNRTTSILGLVGFSYDYLHLRGRLKNAQKCLNERNTKFSTVFEY